MKGDPDFVPFGVRFSRPAAGAAREHSPLSKRVRFLLGCLGVVLLVHGSCTLVDPSCTDRDISCSPVAGSVGAAARFFVPHGEYASCADLGSRVPGAADGEYALTLPGGTITVFCYNMASSPVEYLTFQNCNANGQPNANSSFYARGVGNINVTVGGLWTWYNRVRFNPAALTINPTDRTFATNNGGDRWFGANHFYDNDYGNASACGCDGTQGTANIDLTGTPLTVAAGQFTVGGGAAVYSSDNKIVDLTGGGCCGGTGITASVLQLAW